MDNTKKTVKNSLLSVIAQVITLLLSFVNRRVFVHFLDIEYLGYQSLFSNVFLLLSVAELGIGNIITFHLYKEIVDDNKEEIGRLLYLYKWVYRIVAVLVFITGLLLSLFLKSFVKDATSDWDYLYLVYFLQLSGVVLGYFLSYKRALFIVSQQEYKCVQTDLYVNSAIQAVQLVFLALFHNYIVYLCLQISVNLISNIIISYRCNKEYPFVKKKYELTKEYIQSLNFFRDIRDFLFHRVAYSVYGGTDNIIISAFLGVRYVGLYGNYIMVKTGVLELLCYKLLNPVQATIGNIVYGNRTKEELWNQFKVFDVFSFFFASYIGVGFLVFYQPFIQLWMGEEYLLPDSFVFLFSITIYLGTVWEIVFKYRNVFGDYKQDRNYMILSAILNICISIPGAKYYGIAGIQFGTLVAYLPIGIGRIRFVVKNFMGQSMSRYLLKHLVLLIIAVGEMALCFSICRVFQICVLGLIERFAVWLLLPLTINVLLFCRNPYFHSLVQYLKRGLGYILKRQ